MTSKNYFEIFTHNIHEIKRLYESGKISTNEKNELLRINSDQYENELAKQVKK